MAEPESLFSVAVIGAMNPTIHVPDWYGYISALTPDEVDAAKKSPSFLCTRVAAQFDVANLAMNCTEQKWILRSDADSAERALSIATNVFKVLDQTPVSAFGVNFDNHIHVGADAGALMATRLSALIGSQTGSAEPIVGASVKYRQQLDGRDLIVTIEPSMRGNDWIFVALNYHYELQLDDWQNFDLPKMMCSAVGKDEGDAQERAKSLVAGLAGET